MEMGFLKKIAIAGMLLLGRGVFAQSPVQIAPSQEDIKTLAPIWMGNAKPPFPGFLNLSTYLAAENQIPVVQATFGPGFVWSSLKNEMGNLQYALYPIGGAFAGGSYEGNTVDYNFGFITDVSGSSFYRATFANNFYLASFQNQPNKADDCDFTFATGMAYGESGKRSILIGTQNLNFDALYAMDLTDAIMIGTGLTANQVAELKTKNPSLITTAEELGERMMYAQLPNGAFPYGTGVPATSQGTAARDLTQVRRAVGRLMTDPQAGSLIDPNDLSALQLIAGTFDQAFPNIASSIPFVAAANAANATNGASAQYVAAGSERPGVLNTVRQALHNKK